MSKIFIISGPTCSGKDTIISLILEKNQDWHRLVTMTSRPKSKIEDETSYRFKSQDQFKKLIKEREMFEWARVHNNYYGNTKAYIREILSFEQPVVGDVDIQGAKTYKEKLGKRVVLIFLKTSNLKVLEKRIRKRDRGESETEINKRLKRAKEELAFERNFDYTVINLEGRVEQTVKKIEQIILAEIES